MNGTVNPNYLPTTVTFEYGTSLSYGQSMTVSQNPITGNNITNVSVELTGLTEGTTYHFRIKTENSLGTVMGNDLYFTTLLLPTVITGPTIRTSFFTVTSGGEVISDGGAPIIVSGVCWSTSPIPTVALSTKTSDGNGTGTFTSNITTGIEADNKFYVRAYATSSAGTGYGDEFLLERCITTWGSLEVNKITETEVRICLNAVKDLFDQIDMSLYLVDENGKIIAQESSFYFGFENFVSICKDVAGLKIGTTYTLTGVLGSFCGAEIPNPISFTL